MRGSPNYFSYKEEEIVFTIFNIVEIYLSILRDFGEDFAEEVYREYSSAVVEVSDEILKEAMKFKLKHKERNLSYVDAIGYIYALKNNLKFLTGDKEFKNLDNVEFIQR